MQKVDGQILVCCKSEPNCRETRQLRLISVQLRDGDLVVFRRPDSPLWQFRYRVKLGQCHRQSTKRASLEQAIQVACEAFDLAMFRQRLGLAHTAHSFAQIADYRFSSGLGSNTDSISRT